MNAGGYRLAETVFLGPGFRRDDGRDVSGRVASSSAALALERRFIRHPAKAGTQERRFSRMIAQARHVLAMSLVLGPGFRRDERETTDFGRVSIRAIRKSMSGYVYILASRKHGTLYIGVTSDLPKRMYEHRVGAVGGFTRRHGVKRLVYFEAFDDIEAAIVREKRMKEWQRNWKIRLVERDNPDWNDLAVSVLGFDPLPSRTLAHRHPGESRDPRTRKYPIE